MTDDIRTVTRDQLAAALHAVATDSHKNAIATGFPDRACGREADAIFAALPAQPADGVPRTTTILLGRLIGRHHREMLLSRDHCAACHNFTPSFDEVRAAIEAETAQPQSVSESEADRPAPGLDRDLLDQSVNVLHGMRNFILHNRECAFAKGITGIETENVPCSCGFDQVEAAYDSLIDRLLARLRGGER